jgi:hypothetical protein
MKYRRQSADKERELATLEKQLLLLPLVEL